MFLVPFNSYQKNSRLLEHSHGGGPFIVQGEHVVETWISNFKSVFTMSKVSHIDEIQRAKEAFSVTRSFHVSSIKEIVFVWDLLA